MQPLFLQGKRGKVFSLFYPNRQHHFKHKSVLFLPPFAEEMNKSRHMMAKQARALQDKGIASLIFDYYGTGDSEGRFDEAGFDDWCSDCQSAIEFLKQQGIDEVIIVAIRFGALMAVNMLDKISVNVSALIFWQPILKGETMVTQFLRLKVAADMMDGGNKITTGILREHIERGEFVEVAGYSLKAELISKIDLLRLEDLAEKKPCKIVWFELVPNLNRKISAVNLKFISRLTENNFDIEAITVIGETFWNVPELATVPELIKTTTEKICTLMS